MLVNDAQSRIDDHLSGKLHIAYLRIAEIITEVEKVCYLIYNNYIIQEKEKARAAFEPPEEKIREKSSDRVDKDRRSKDKERDRDRRDHRERDKDRDRKKDR